MSRAINVNATPAEVATMCGNKKVGYSVIEPIQSGGTRVVLLNARDAATVTTAFGKKVMKEHISRTPMRLRHS